MKDPDSKLAKGLVAWYGLYQVVHIGVNLRSLFDLARGSIDFPALPPSNGWAPQAIHFFTGMAGLDLFNAVLTLLFVFGYFRRTRWRFWLGTLTLTVSFYAALLFNYTTFVSGAWTQSNLGAYLFTNVTFLPIVLLFGLFCMWGWRGELR